MSIETLLKQHIEALQANTEATQANTKALLRGQEPVNVIDSDKTAGNKADETPVKKPSKAKKAPKEEKEQTASGDFEKSDVLDAMKKAAEVAGRGEVKKVLEDHNAKKIGEIAVEDYASVMKALTALAEGE